MKISAFRISCFTMLFFVLFPVLSRAEEWVCLSGNLAEGDLRWAVSDLNKPNIFYAASQQILFKSPDGGASWRQMFKAWGEGNQIQCVHIDRSKEDTQDDHGATQSRYALAYQSVAGAS